MKTVQQLSNTYEKISKVARMISRSIVIIGCGFSIVMLLINLYVPDRKMATIAGVYRKDYEDIWFNFITSTLLLLLTGFFIKLFSIVIFTASYDLAHDDSLDDEYESEEINGED